MNISIIKSKFKRVGGELLKKTFLWKENQYNDCLYNKILENTDIDEKPIIFFNDLDEKQFWCLTDKRLFISSDLNYIYLNDLMKIDILDIKDNPNNKTSSTLLTLYTRNQTINLTVEYGSWHIIYNIFKYIIEKTHKLQ